MAQSFLRNRFMFVPSLVIAVIALAYPFAVLAASIFTTVSNWFLGQMLEGLTESDTSFVIGNQVFAAADTYSTPLNWTAEFAPGLGAWAFGLGLVVFLGALAYDAIVDRIHPELAEAAA